MKILLLFALIITLSDFGFGQSKSITLLKKERKAFKDNKYYAVGYDKFKDISIVSFNGSAMGGKTQFLLGGSFVSFGVDFYFKGQELTETPQNFILQFVGYSKGIKNTFNGLTLYVIADEKRFEYQEGIKDNIFNQDIFGHLQTTQTLKFVIGRQDLETFAAAKSLEIKAGEQIYKVDAKRQKIFKDILAISEVK